MGPDKSTIPISLGNLEEFKAGVDAEVEKKIQEAGGTGGLTFATTEQIKALFAE